MREFQRIQNEPTKLVIKARVQRNMGRGDADGRASTVTATIVEGVVPPAPVSIPLESPVPLGPLPVGMEPEPANVELVGVEPVTPNAVDVEVGPRARL